MNYPTHKTTQVERVKRWLQDNPHRELSQADANLWRPPVPRLGAVIWVLRHEHNMDIIARRDDKKAHYRLASEAAPVAPKTPFNPPDLDKDFTPGVVVPKHSAVDTIREELYDCLSGLTALAGRINNLIEKLK